MRYCSHCGVQINDEAVVCLKCGCSVANANKQFVTIVNPDDAPSGGFALLGFFIPLIGLILWILWNNTSPQKAKSCGKGAIIGIIVIIVVSVLAAIIGGAVIAGALSSYF